MPPKRGAAQQSDVSPADAETQRILGAKLPEVLSASQQLAAGSAALAPATRAVDAMNAQRAMDNAKAQFAAAEKRGDETEMRRWQRSVATLAGALQKLQR